ncbi:hypothetical protein FOMPIDRAFT_82640 [Fomitopsis schrenkii]|uniref:Hydrophobin n=1 Tax=Fomitopsis schrenkii TaxID=2126942 RepID=S8FMD0_FOMSC|nr:hypothetical protein FOMPIDRAFT_82640 [Fomitopsis schrenkii]
MRFAVNIAAALSLSLALMSAPPAAAQTTCGTVCTSGTCPVGLTCTPITIPLSLVPGCTGPVVVNVCL